MYTHTLMDAHTQTNIMKTPKALCETCNLQWQSCFLCNHHAPWNRWHWHGMSARLEPKYVPAQSACRCLSTALVPTGKTPPKSYWMRVCECVHACKQVCMCVCVCVHVSVLHGPHYILSVCKCVSYGILNLFWTPTQTDRTMDLCKKQPLTIASFGTAGPAVLLGQSLLTVTMAAIGWISKCHIV